MSIRIQNIRGITTSELYKDLHAGGKFVTYQYCISILFMTFRPPTNIFFVRSGQSTILQSLPFTILTFLFGWWGFPWGAVFTIDTLINNFRGGKDVTAFVVAALSTQQSTAKQVLFNPLPTAA